jgi:hypothetical protein
VSALWNAGLDRWADWRTAPMLWLICDGSFLFSRTDDVVADIAASEITAAGYTRQSVAATVQADGTEGGGGQVMCYGCTPPEWTGVAPGQAMRALVLALDGGTDEASGLIAWWSLSDPTDLGDFSISFGPWAWFGLSPLPGGDATTRLVHSHRVAGT